MATNLDWEFTQLRAKVELLMREVRRLATRCRSLSDTVRVLRGGQALDEWMNPERANLLTSSQSSKLSAWDALKQKKGVSKVDYEIALTSGGIARARDERRGLDVSRPLCCCCVCCCFKCDDLAAHARQLREIALRLSYVTDDDFRNMGREIRRFIKQVQAGCTAFLHLIAHH